MVTRYGFSEKLGPVVYGQDEGEIFLGRDISQNRNFSENVAAEIDVEVRELVDNAYESAKSILTDHMVSCIWWQNMCTIMKRSTGKNSERS